MALNSRTFPRKRGAYTFALLGKKVGMTQFFAEGTGDVVPVTVIEVGPCVVLQKENHRHRRL